MTETTTTTATTVTTTPEIAPIVEAAAAVEATIVNPSIPVLAGDLLLAHKLVSEVKQQLAGKHPTITALFRALFNLA